MHNPLDPTYEQTLIEQAQSQPQAFRELYRHYFPRLYAYVAYRVGSIQDAEDLVSDIFLHVVEALGQFEYRGAGSFAAWLFRIAHNQVTQHYRRQRRGFEAVTLDEITELASGMLPLDQVVQHKEQAAVLRRLIASLSDRRQEVVMLKFFGGLRNREISAVLGLDERTVASHLCRALEDLQRKFPKAWVEDTPYEPQSLAR